jgi:hypothetical protein
MAETQMLNDTQAAAEVRQYRLAMVVATLTEVRAYQSANPGQSLPAEMQEDYDAVLLWMQQDPQLAQEASAALQAGSPSQTPPPTTPSPNSNPAPAAAPPAASEPVPSSSAPEALDSDQALWEWIRREIAIDPSLQPAPGAAQGAGWKRVSRDPQTGNFIATYLTGADASNPNPIYEIPFSDGKKLVVQWDNQHKIWVPQAGSTAWTEANNIRAKRATAAEKANQYHYIERDDGSIVAIQGTNYQTVVPPASAKKGTGNALHDLLAGLQQQLDYANERDRIRIAQGQLSVAQATQQADERYQQAQLQLNRLISDRSYSSEMSKQGMDAMATAAQYRVPEGWSADFTSQLNNLASGQPVQFQAPKALEMPWDKWGNSPEQAPFDLASQALGGPVAGSGSAGQSYGASGLATGQSSRGLDYTPSEQEAAMLQYIHDSAIKAGLGEDGARAAMAIAATEGGMTGAVGDNGQSFGPYQFYVGGQLANFAREHGMSMQEAGQYIQTHPQEAVDWALNGYLGNAIKQGKEKGYVGPDLATYGQQYGQVSITPYVAGNYYKRMFGDGSEYAADPTDPGAAPRTATTPSQPAPAARPKRPSVEGGPVTRSQSIQGSIVTRPKPKPVPEEPVSSVFVTPSAPDRTQRPRPPAMPSFAASEPMPALPPPSMAVQPTASPATGGWQAPPAATPMGFRPDADPEVVALLERLRREREAQRSGGVAGGLLRR